MPSLPWDFVVAGTPISTNAGSVSKERWKRKVSAAAQAAWPPGDPPLTDTLEIHVTCFHDSAQPLDTDNMLKPIQDALNGIAYVDDKQITHTHGHMLDLNSPWVVRGISEQLGRGFGFNEAFVHIRIEAAPTGSRLP